MPATIASRDERVFKEIRRLCYAGLDAGTLLHEAMRHLKNSVPSVGYAAATLDPVSGLPTSAFMGNMGHTPEEARFFLENIYFEDPVSEYGWMARNRLPALSLSEATDGHLERALRHREFNAPIKGLGYEMRAVFMAGGLWGGACLVREQGDPDFSRREIDLVRRLSPHLGAGLRAATLRQQAAGEPKNTEAGVLILDEKWRVVQRTPAAERLLHELDGLEPPGAERWREDEGLPTAVWSASMSLRTALRDEREHDTSAAPCVYAFSNSGRWLTLQASLTEASVSRPAETVVIIAPAVPHEVFRLRKSAYSLSFREEQITDLVVAGRSTREISRALYISEYTVQDHLKHVFGKVGVKSRRELVKRLFLDNLPG